jgi:Zn-dependent M16 (insulinase) family peptidase
LKERQAAPDKPEDVAKIPRLALSDVDKDDEKIPFSNVNGMTNIEVDTNKIVYVSTLFEVAPNSEYSPSVLSFLSDVLGRLDTEHYSYSDLSNEIDLHTGGIGTGLSIIPQAAKIDGQRPDYPFSVRLTAKVKTTLPNLPKGLELVHEILTQTKFDDKARIKEIVQELRANMEQSLISAGHRFAQGRAASYVSRVNQYREQSDGIDYYRFLVDLEKNFDTKFDGFAADLKRYSQKLFNASTLHLSVTLPADEFKTLQSKNIFADYRALFPKTQPVYHSHEPSVLTQANEAVIIPSRVQYVVKAADYEKSGFEYSGKMLVLTNILRTNYLWNNVRVLGGAYGGGVSIDRSGVFSLWSYRDPHLKRTVDIFDGVADYLEKLELSDEELSKAIIATIGGLDKPLTPSEKGGKVTAMLLTGLSFADLQRERDEVLSTTVEDLRGFAKMFREGMKQNNICVFGNEEKLKEDATLFKTTIRPIE